MDSFCFVNDKIHTNFYGNHSQDFLRREERITKEEIRRNICKDLENHKHSDGNFYCIFHLPNEDKNENEFREASNKLIFEMCKKLEEINALPDDKQELEKAKIKYDFRYVRFPCAFGFIGSKVEIEMDFSHAVFFDVADFMKTEFLAYANFDSVIFHKVAYFIFAKFHANAYFFSAKFLGKADFKYTFFSNGKFTNSEFSEIADFEFSEFAKDANFINVSFVKKINFQYAKLFIANFENAKFLNTANFKQSELSNYVFFKGNNENLVFGNDAVLDLQDARIEKPERIIFHTIRLLPNWFVNIDSRKMVFTDIEWENIRNNYRNENLKNELKNLEKRGLEKPKQLFRISCRQLAENAENNNRYEEASNFRRMAMETEWFERKEKLKSKPENFLNFLRQLRDIPIYALYRFSSSYGERWGRAFAVLLVILTLFAIIYTQVKFYNYPKDKTISESIAECKNNPEKPECGNQALAVGDAILHSLTTATFQNVDYRKPATVWGELWVMLEKIFAPLQAALLALAIRRKFMR